MERIAPKGVLLDRPDLEPVRSILRSARRASGLTQKRLADITGRSSKAISDFEKGRTDPPSSMVLELLMAVGLSVRIEPRQRPDGPEPGDAREVDDGL